MAVMEIKFTIYESAKDGAFGIFDFNGVKFHGVTPYWMNNQKNKSCVPPGRYKLEYHTSNTHPGSWALVNHDLGISHYETPGVPRNACLIHSANWAHELEGCIAPGLNRVGDMVRSSKTALEDINDMLQKNEEHYLTIEFGVYNERNN